MSEPALSQVPAGVPIGAVSIRRLGPADLPQVTAHFLRLSSRSRRLRFGGVVSDTFLEQYASAIFEAVSIVFGAEVDGVLRGVTEIRGSITQWTQHAEAAISIEDAWQDRGIGDALLKRIIRAARNRGIAQLYMVCLHENRKMKHLAHKNEAILDYSVDSVEGRIVDLHPSFRSLFEEWYDEASLYLSDMVRAERG
ncbi:MAG: GNAT family N-acetyltransferase [Nitratireductor sp.]|nr:GNAT family N-acetyltransferase [Nitratireductor sp.]